MKENQRKLEIEYRMNSNETCIKIAQKYGADKGEFRDLSNVGLGKWVKIVPKSKPNPPADSVSQAVLEIEKMGYKVEQKWFVGNWEVYKMNTKTKIVAFDLTRNGTIELSNVFEFRIDEIDNPQILDSIASLYGLESTIPQQHSGAIILQ